MSRQLVVVGDVVLDRDVNGRVERLAPDAPVPVVDEPEERVRPGGAGLAAALAAKDGRDVVIVTALADDLGGRLLRTELEAAGAEVIDLGSDGRTGEKVRVRTDGRSLIRLDYGGPVGKPGPLSAEGEEAIASAGGVLVSDYGRGITAEPSVRRALQSMCRRVPIVWDPHPRGAAPVRGVRLFTPNRRETATFAPGVEGDDIAAIALRARVLRRRFGASGVVVTMGARGALLASGDAVPFVVPTSPVPVGDPCGAGDRFSSTAAGLLSDGALPSEAVAGAVSSATAFVAAGGAGGAFRHAAETRSRPEENDPRKLARRVRAEGGTVVATSGCFDLLHAGHIGSLVAARALGDCLIVCLNSDASVRRLKGPGRPVVTAPDRAEVLSALQCVDGVIEFDDLTPIRVLQTLRPHIFAKGGDYSAGQLPEARALAEWGGQAVILPYVKGRSTTGLMKEVVRRGTA